MKKRCLCGLLVLCMLLSLLPTAVLAQAAPNPGSPQVGDQVQGFTVTQVSRFELVDADMIIYQHNKTGALVCWLSNEDTNRAFQIAFRTPTPDDTGIPHVLEHATLDGSEKYPSPALFFDLSAQTYNTFMNAGTYDITTMYPLASLSEDQLLALAKYYVDSVFCPCILEDESIFHQEAWRYELADAEAALTLNGTVYSEMQGAFTLDWAALRQTLKALFPGSAYSNESGGNPANIPEMTWDNLTQFHSQYYIPSNSLSCLYGKIENVETFLALLDGYFSQYDDTPADLEDSGYVPIQGAVTRRFEYAVEAGSDTNNASVAYYGILCPQLTQEEIYQYMMLTQLLSEDSSQLMEDLRTALPSASCSVMFETASPEPVLLFEAQNVNEDQLELFRDTVNGALAEMAKNGFAEGQVDAIASALKKSILLTSENSDAGVSVNESITYYWADWGDVNGYGGYIAAIDSFAQWAQDGVYTGCLDTLIASQRSALTVTVPVPGLKEAQDEALAEQLAAYKASLNDEEVAAVVQATADYASAVPIDDSASLAELKVVSAATLPEEVRLYDITYDVGADGVAYYAAAAETEDIGETMLLLDASGLPLESLHDYQLYADLLGQLNTSAHTVSQLAVLDTRYYGGSILPVEIEMDNDRGYTPYLQCDFTVLNDELPQAYDLLSELLYDTQFTDTQALTDAVSRVQSSLRQSLNNAAYLLAIYRIEAAGCPGDTQAQYYNYQSLLDYYAYLTGLLQELAENPDGVQARLEAVQDYFRSRTGAVCLYSGSQAGNQANRTAAEHFFQSLESRPLDVQSYDFPAVSSAEGLVVDSAVQYNGLFASNETLGIEEFTGDLDVITGLISNQFLYPMLRDLGGAYGVFHVANQFGIYILSYRDPNVESTFQVYDGLAEALAALEIDQDTLDGYIVGSYSYYALNDGEIAGGINAAQLELSGRSQAETLDYMRQIKAVTVNDLKNYVELYQKLAELGCINTAGSASAIAANETLYDTVLNPFAVEAPADFTDVSPDSWYYNAVYFVRDNGVMDGAGDGLFQPERSVTRGMLATVLHRMLGEQAPAGEAAFDDVAQDAWYADAVLWCAEQGIVAGYGDGSFGPEDPVTREQLAVMLYRVARLAGLDVSVRAEASLEGYADAGAVSDYAAEALLWTSDTGILAGDGASLLPDHTANRAQLAAVLARLFNAG